MRIALIILTVIVLVGVGVMLMTQRGQPPTNGNGAANGTVTPADGVTPTPLRSDNIVVTSPQAGSTIGVPVVIRGEARTFENTVNVRLSEQGGRVLVEDFTTAQSPDIGQFGPFEISLSYPQPTGREGIIEVFQYSARDGSEIDKVTIPVVFEDAQTLSLQVFFNNTQQGAECEQIVATTRRVERTQQTARAALNELLRGPTRSEAEQGFVTSINPGVQIQRLVIENGVASVDFDETLQSQVGGSCRVSAIRAQITQTLLQFDTVNEVVISINGRTEDILQP